MQTRNKQILFGVIVVLLVIAFIYVTRENDPVYEGKRLSEHLQRLQGFWISFGGANSSPSDAPKGPSVIHSDDLTTLQAIDAVGTNALPMLARMLGSKNSRFRLWLDKVATKHALLAKLHRTSLTQITQAWAEQGSALVAFTRLGPRAAPAVPDIIRLLEDPDCAMSAMVALSAIRPERERDILSLTNVLGIQTLPWSGGPVGLLQSSAFLVLSTFGNKASNATTLLINCLTSTNEYIYSAAAVALARIGATPEKVVPLIMANLPKTNPPSPTFPSGPGARTNLASFGQQRMQLMQSGRNVGLSVWALGEYSRHASNALPILSNLEEYPDSFVQKAARAAVAKISGDTNSVSGREQKETAASSKGDK